METAVKEVIGIDHEASDALKKLLGSLNIEADVIRIFIAGMGCSGVNFNLAKDEVQDTDLVREFEGMKYVVSKSLAEEFEGFDIIYYNNLGQSGLVVKPRKIIQSGGGCATCSGCC